MMDLRALPASLPADAAAALLVQPAEVVAQLVAAGVLTATPDGVSRDSIRDHLAERWAARREPLSPIEGDWREDVAVSMSAAGSLLGITRSAVSKRCARGELDRVRGGVTTESVRWAMAQREAEARVRERRVGKRSV